MAIVTDEANLVGEEISGTPISAGRTGVLSGVSWSAVIAGAVTAVAVSSIVIALGSGIGMSVISPYSYSAPSTGTMTVIGALWLVFAQAVGFATGGYVAGRLRRAPTSMHTDEVNFRDGANGLITWAIAVVLTFFVVAAVVNKIGSAAGSAAATAATAAFSGAASQPQSMDYFTDMLFRPSPQGGANGAAGVNATGQALMSSNGANDQRNQIDRIMLTALGPNGMSNDDRTYLAQIVAAHTGISQDDAQRRVDDVINRAKQDATQAAETARKAAAYLSFWTFMSLLFGAASATLGGVLGGDIRDEFAVHQAVPASPR